MRILRLSQFGSFGGAIRFFTILLVGFVSSALPIGCSSKEKATQDESRRALVLMTDFGIRDGAVSAMKGVAFSTAPGVLVSDLTHEIPSFSIWDAAYRLHQTFKYWPAGTVFVAVVDPGVGSERKSLALVTKTGHIFVGPDNGLFTLVADSAGVASVYQIEEAKQRLKGSEESYTFHGRDLYVYVGSRLAQGAIQLSELGPAIASIERLSYQKATFDEASAELVGNIPVLDPQYGNVWTNIPKSLFQTKLLVGPKVQYRVRISKRDTKGQAKTLFNQILPLGETFSAVPVGRPLLYFNSLLNVSLALNQADFAKKFGIQSGPDWLISISPHRISR
jgi:S-adenosylmethionine hydrolase